MASHLKHLARRYGLLVLPTTAVRLVLRKAEALDYSIFYTAAMPIILPYIEQKTKIPRLGRYSLGAAC